MLYLKPFGSEHPLRALIRARYLEDEQRCVQALVSDLQQSMAQNEIIRSQASILVKSLRDESRKTSLIDQFLQEFTLSSEEGIVLMCLAEALLRIPDAETADALIRDKLGSGNWHAHLGKSDSLLVNASTWGMLLTGKWMTLGEQMYRDPGETIKRMVAKSGEPAIRLALRQAMKMMGREFVLAETMEKALKKASSRQQKGFRYSYDMLGEAARTQADAERYTRAYQNAIDALGRAQQSNSPLVNPGISVKLSALHPRYEFAQTKKVESELYECLLDLAQQAKAAHIGFNIDAEEADRLELSLSLLEKLAYEPSLANWDGLGFVVQAYQKRASAVIDWLSELAEASGHRLMLRLVKGAYWDSEIKFAQLLGHADYPVFTRKENTDLSYLVCAQKLLLKPDQFYPQFATHNAHTVAAVMAYAKDQDVSANGFEFQCLHGMGEALYQNVVREQQYQCRIYAPVGPHHSLLAYLVRRLLENGANTSFVNLLANKDQDVAVMIANPVDKVRKQQLHRHPGIALPDAMFGEKRKNSRGANLNDADWLDSYQSYIDNLDRNQWRARPLTGHQNSADTKWLEVENPARAGELVGVVQFAFVEQVQQALEIAKTAQYEWDALGGDARAKIMEKAADLYEHNRFELMALCQLEAGKTLLDAVSEVREAIDFLRFYAQGARAEFGDSMWLTGPTGERNEYLLRGRGVFACISPWNFPLAIFTGQVSAALVAGNAVLAKPAEQTPLIAWRAVQLLHEAGVPDDVLHYLPGTGETIGAALTSDPRVDGVVFTGGTDTARRIHQSLSNRPNTALPHLIAETGGLNTMIVDSSALLEQVVADVIVSAFQSAGQRCSALRVLYVQSDIADSLIKMIEGAMQMLVTGDPMRLASDVGPIIDAQACASLNAHIQSYAENGLIARAAQARENGHFVEPALIEIEGIAALEKEVFGPVLHVARFASEALDEVVSEINASGFGLTLGIHSRIDSTVSRIRARARVGNIYINRNMIGAVVGVQPFGGEGLSGTGPKAGGPHYLHRFAVERVVSTDTTAAGGNASLLTLSE